MKLFSTKPTMSCDLCKKHSHWRQCGDNRPICLICANQYALFTRAPFDAESILTTIQKQTETLACIGVNADHVLLASVDVFNLKLSCQFSSPITPIAEQETVFGLKIVESEDFDGVHVFKK